MDIGPLEYIVLSVPDQQLRRSLFKELSVVQTPGQIRVVDLVHVAKAADGTVVIQEASELLTAEPTANADITGNLMRLLTAEDIEQLTGQIPADTSALVILFEHTWVLGLTEALRRGGGKVLIGGLVHHEVLAQVGAELATEKEVHHA